MLFSFVLFSWSLAMDLFSDVLFQTLDYVWKHVPTKFWFHFVDIIYIKFRFCEIFTIINSVTRFHWLKHYKCKTIKCWFILYLHMYVQMFPISRLAFLHFTLHWHLHCSNSIHQKYARFFNQSDCRYFAFQR